MTEKTKLKDFIEIKYSGYANNQLFDSNIEEDLKKLNPEAKPEKTIIVIGEKMVVQGLDKALEDKELNKEYKISFSYEEGFGQRRRELVRVLPLKSFTEQKINPHPGMVFALDQNLVKVLAVSGARVTTDFNNPLAGKELTYKFTIKRILSEKDEKEKTETLLKTFFRFLPEFEISQDKITVKGPKPLEYAVNAFKEKFKELLKKELTFEEVQPKKAQENKEVQPKKEEKETRQLT